MKKEFYALVSNGNGKKLIQKEGDYDATLGVFYHKESDGWSVTDSYSGSSLLTKQKTKKDAQNALSKFKDKIEEIRNGEKYLQGVINYNEMLEDDTSTPMPF